MKRRINDPQDPPELPEPLPPPPRRHRLPPA